MLCLKTLPTMSLSGSNPWLWAAFARAEWITCSNYYDIILIKYVFFFHFDTTYEGKQLTSQTFTKIGPGKQFWQPF
jgi:hypothetical protein